MLANCDVVVIFLVYAQFGAIWKPDSERIICKTYISINSNLLSYKNWKISDTALTLLLLVKVLFLPKVLTSTKLRGTWYWKVYFLQLHRCRTNLRTKFQLSSVILTSFRQMVVILSSTPTSKRTPKKSTQIRANANDICLHCCFILFWERQLRFLIYTTYPLNTRTKN